MEIKKTFEAILTEEEAKVIMKFIGDFCTSDMIKKHGMDKNEANLLCSIYDAIDIVINAEEYGN